MLILEKCLSLSFVYGLGEYYTIRHERGDKSKT